MRAVLVGATLLAIMAAPAAAADLPVKARPMMPAPAPVYNWTGFYIGVQGGYAWGNVGSSFATVGGVTGSQDFKTRGGMAGGHLGYNFQNGIWVFGVEGDGEWANIKGDDGGFGGVTDAYKVRWQASARGRLGVTPAENVLLYATGGAAFAGMDYTLTAIPATAALTNSDTRVGWTVGAGVEWSFLQNWSARLEYRYSDFGSKSISFPAASGIAAQTVNSDYSQHAIRGGISYRFGGGPIMARY
jgi:outer membrane immunogenic protein